MNDPHDPNELLGRAERIIAKANERGINAEVYMTRSVGLDLELENSHIQSTGRSRVEGGGIRVIDGGRIGFAYFTSDDDAEATIDRALQLATLAPRKNMELAQPGDYPSLSGRWDDDLAQLEVGDALELAHRLLDASGQATDLQLAGGGVNLGYGLEAIANTNGVAVADRSTEVGAGINLVMEHGETAINSWDSEQRHKPGLDPEALFERVATDLRSLRDPVESKTGPADVVFRPSAASELITGLVLSAVEGDDAMRGKTVWSNRLGEEVAAKGLSIVDDPFVDGALGATTFDGDGLPAHRLPIIKDGVLENFLFDLRDGSEHNQPTTHSAVRSSFKSPPGIGTNHLVIQGPSEKDLIAGIDDGYLVESVLGAHTANATTGDFSVTAPNVWRIQKGEVIGAATEIAIGSNLPDLLHRLDGMGAEAKHMDGMQVPMLRFRDVQVSA